MPWNPQTVLVTGASGFVGGALSLRLAGEGAHIRALVRTPEKAAFLNEFPTIQIVQGDFTDAACLAEVIPGSEVVFHIGAALSGDLATQQHNNILGTRLVAEAAAAAGVKRMVHMSSISVYGMILPPEIDEDQPLAPTPDPYSITKAEAEHVLRQVAAERQLSCTILRPGAIYGPRSRGWTVRTFKMARRQPIVFIGSGQGDFPAIFIDDLVDLCLLAATHPAAEGQTFNAVMDPPPTQRQYLEALAALVGGRRWLGVPGWLVLGPARLLAALSPQGSLFKAGPPYIRGIQSYTRYSNTRARDLLGWQPKTDLSTGIQRSAEWLKEVGLLQN
jgi:nucleoside-diphosphate-sugar epimerase